MVRGMGCGARDVERMRRPRWSGRCMHQELVERYPAMAFVGCADVGASSPCVGGHRAAGHGPRGRQAAPVAAVCEPSHDFGPPLGAARCSIYSRWHCGAGTLRRRQGAFVARHAPANTLLTDGASGVRTGHHPHLGRARECAGQTRGTAAVRTARQGGGRSANPRRGSIPAAASIASGQVGTPISRPSVVRSARPRPSSCRDRARKRGGSPTAAAPRRCPHPRQEGP